MDTTRKRFKIKSITDNHTIDIKGDDPALWDLAKRLADKAPEINRRQAQLAVSQAQSVEQLADLYFGGLERELRAMCETELREVNQQRRERLQQQQRDYYQDQLERRAIQLNTKPPWDQEELARISEFLWKNTREEDLPYEVKQHGWHLTQRDWNEFAQQVEQRVREKDEIWEKRRQEWAKKQEPPKFTMNEQQRRDIHKIRKLVQEGKTEQLRAIIQGILPLHPDDEVEASDAQPQQIIGGQYLQTKIKGLY